MCDARTRRRVTLLLFVSLYLLASVAAVAQTVPSASPTPTPTPMPFPDWAIEAEKPIAALSLEVWIGASLVFLVGLVAFAIMQSRRLTAAHATGDKDLEASRIYYGFWLIIASLLLTLAVVVVTVNAFKPDRITTADILAIISTVSGIIGTLIAAFFGIQAAGAGRSQALSALQAIQTGGASRAQYKLDPGYGPHAGNTRVAISGNGFTGSNAVNFGADPGLNFELVNDGLIRITTPPRDLAAPSDAAVAVVFPTAAVQNLSVGTFFYYTVMPIPTTGPIAGGTQVTISGTGLAGAIGVNFGDSHGGNFAVLPDGSLHATSPAVQTAGDVPISVVFQPPTATNSTIVGKFTYT